jgi:hypothetical protein
LRSTGLAAAEDALYFKLLSELDSADLDCSG